MCCWHKLSWNNLLNLIGKGPFSGANKALVNLGFISIIFLPVSISLSLSIFSYSKLISLRLSIQHVRKIFRRNNISHPLIRTRCAYQRVRNVGFFGKFCIRTKWMTPFKISQLLSFQEYLIVKQTKSFRILISPISSIYLLTSN